MTAFTANVFKKTTISFPDKEGKPQLYLGLLSSQRASIAANLGYDPSFVQVFTFRLTNPPKLESPLAAGSLGTVVAGDSEILGKTLKLLETPIKKIEITSIVGTKLTLVLEDRNYLGSRTL